MGKFKPTLVSKSDLGQVGPTALARPSVRLTKAASALE
jgi:hypothetical protein